MRKATTAGGEVGRASKQVAETFYPHFEREDELALPVIGMAREVAEGKAPQNDPKALELCEKFRVDHEEMLRGT